MLTSVLLNQKVLNDRVPTIISVFVTPSELEYTPHHLLTKGTGFARKGGGMYSLIVKRAKMAHFDYSSKSR